MQCSLPVLVSVWQVGPAQGSGHSPYHFVMKRSGDEPGEKFEVPGSRVSGVRSPLVSTITEPILFACAPAGRLHGRGLAGKMKLAASSSFRAALFLEGFTGMKVTRVLTARGATKFPPPSWER